MKKAIKIILGVLLGIVCAAALFIGYLTVTEFKPGAVEAVEIDGSGNAARMSPKQEISILTWNIGYAGLGKESDFFMDGGTHTASADKNTVERYLFGITDYVESVDADVVLLQEVDQNSTRSYGIDQTARFEGKAKVFAKNYSCSYVPFPMPPIGRVQSGLLTTSKYDIDYAERISLPCPFSWPVRTANLKRCLLASYLPLQGTDKKLVMINLHLEAYDSGEGKIAQTKQLRDFIQSEYDKGNYVIAGGDFNQTFPGAVELYPIKNPELWEPGILDESILPENWGFACDISQPSCRLLNQPYDPYQEDTQHYVIDGFIVSPNIWIQSVEGIDLGFENSDHNPVLMKLTLK